MAIGDDEGVLRVAEVPSMLRRPAAGEHARMQRFLDTQAKKVADVEQRQVCRTALQSQPSRLPGTVAGYEYLWAGHLLLVNGLILLVFA